LAILFLAFNPNALHQKCIQASKLMLLQSSSNFRQQNFPFRSNARPGGSIELQTAERIRCQTRKLSKSSSTKTMKQRREVSFIKIIIVEKIKLKQLYIYI
jgi:hypothetical protein